MRSKTSAAIYALTIALGLGAASARATELNTAVYEPAGSAAQAQPARWIVRPDQPSMTEAEAGTPKPMNLAIKDPEKRFADAPMPVAMHEIHYDDTPKGWRRTSSVGKPSARPTEIAKSSISTVRAPAVSNTVSGASVMLRSNSTRASSNTWT
jgi:hypothetical protein